MTLEERIEVELLTLEIRMFYLNCPNAEIYEEEIKEIIKQRKIDTRLPIQKLLAKAYKMAKKVKEKIRLDTVEQIRKLRNKI